MSRAIGDVLHDRHDPLGRAGRGDSVHEAAPRGDSIRPTCEKVDSCTVAHSPWSFAGRGAPWSQAGRGEADGAWAPGRRRPRAGRSGGRRCGRGIEADDPTPRLDPDSAGGAGAVGGAGWPPLRGRRPGRARAVGTGALPGADGPTGRRSVGRHGPPLGADGPARARPRATRPLASALGRPRRRRTASEPRRLGRAPGRLVATRGRGGRRVRCGPVDRANGAGRPGCPAATLRSRSTSARGQGAVLARRQAPSA